MDKDSDMLLRKYLQIPHSNLTAQTPGRKDLIGRGVERHAPGAPGMPRQSLHMLARGESGDVDGVVAVGRRHEFVVVAEGDEKRASWSPG